MVVGSEEQNPVKRFPASQLSSYSGSAYLSYVSPHDCADWRTNMAKEHGFTLGSVDATILGHNAYVRDWIFLASSERWQGGSQNASANLQYKILCTRERVLMPRRSPAWRALAQNMHV